MKDNFTSGSILFRRGQCLGTKISSRYQKIQALSDFDRFALDAKITRYLNTHQHYLVDDKFRDATVNMLTKSIIAFLLLTGGKAERINNNGRPISNTTFFTDVVGLIHRKGSLKGIQESSTNCKADISATIQGKSLKIKIKIGSYKQSYQQN